MQKRAQTALFVTYSLHIRALRVLDVHLTNAFFHLCINPFFCCKNQSFYFLGIDFS